MKINKKNTFIMLRKSINFALFSLDKILMRNNNLFILCYHSFSDDDWFYSVKIENLKNQIKYLKESGYKFITLDDVFNHISGVKIINYPSVLITIDDGYSDNLKVINYFKEENISPALFLISDKEKVNRKQLGSEKELLTDEQVKKIKNSGWEIGAHTMTHSNLSKMTNEDLVSEIENSKKALEKNLNIPIKYFAYPFGAYNNEVLKKVKKTGYQLAVSMDDSRITIKTDLFRIPRIGVNNTHSLNEFKTLYSPSVIAFRKNIKKLIN